MVACSTDDGLLIADKRWKRSAGGENRRASEPSGGPRVADHAIQHDALNIDYAAKQIFARINIQLRRLAEGCRKRWQTVCSAIFFSGQEPAAQLIASTDS